MWLWLIYIMFHCLLPWNFNQLWWKSIRSIMANSYRLILTITGGHKWGYNEAAMEAECTSIKLDGMLRSLRAQYTLFGLNILKNNYFMLLSFFWETATISSAHPVCTPWWIVRVRHNLWVHLRNQCSYNVVMHMVKGHLLEPDPMVSVHLTQIPLKGLHGKLHDLHSRARHYFKDIFKVKFKALLVIRRN